MGTTESAYQIIARVRITCPGEKWLLVHQAEIRNSSIASRCLSVKGNCFILRLDMQVKDLQKFHWFIAQLHLIFECAQTLSDAVEVMGKIKLLENRKLNALFTWDKNSKAFKES